MSSEIISDLLVNKGLISQKQLQLVKNEQSASGLDISQIVIASGMLEEEQYVKFLAAHYYRCPYYSLQELVFNQNNDDILKLCGFSFAIQHLALPIEANTSSTKLTLVAPAPLSTELEQDLLFRTQKEGILYRLASRPNLIRAIYYYYGRIHLKPADNDPLAKNEILADWDLNNQELLSPQEDAKTAVTKVSTIKKSLRRKREKRDTAPDTPKSQDSLELYGTPGTVSNVDLKGVGKKETFLNKRIAKESSLFSYPAEDLGKVSLILPPLSEPIKVSDLPKPKPAKKSPSTEVDELVDKTLQSEELPALNEIEAQQYQAEESNPFQDEPTAEAPTSGESEECPSCGQLNPEEFLFCSRCGESLDPTHDPYINRILGQKWKLTNSLGKGGVGVVYQAENLENGRIAAIKILDTQNQLHEDVINRFYLEVQASRRLRHPNIIEIYDFGFQEGLGFYIVMELLEGQDFGTYLEEKLSQNTTPTFNELCGIFAQICSAMAFAHEHSIVHRDLKPTNIFLSGDSVKRVKILDFGIAKVQNLGSDRLTNTGFFMGTPHYLSPEQAKGEAVDHRSDIYSLCVIIFESLTSQDLFDADDPYQYMMRHVFATPLTLSEARADLAFPKLLEDLVSAGLSKEKEKRPNSMNEVRERLLSAMKTGAKSADIPHLDPALGPGKAPLAGQYHVSYAEIPKISGPNSNEPFRKDGSYNISYAELPKISIGKSSRAEIDRVSLPSDILKTQPIKNESTIPSLNDVLAKSGAASNFQEGNWVSEPPNHSKDHISLPPQKGESRWTGERAKIRSTKHVPKIKAAPRKAIIPKQPKIPEEIAALSTVHPPNSQSQSPENNTVSSDLIQQLTELPVWIYIVISILAFIGIILILRSQL